MARAKKADAGLAADDSAVIPRLNLSEQGFTGLRTTNGTLIEESNRSFRYPHFLKTVSEMKTDATIAAALSVYRMMISRVKWTIKPPMKASKTDISRAAFAQSCLDDMESSWSQVISEIITYLEYGFSVQEKVFRRRLTRNGSKYNDGLVGIRKIAPRGQDTIRHWNFSTDGRELESIGQSLVNMENGARYTGITNARDGLLQINRDKFLLFSADSVKSNPEGKSILKPVYLAYKQLIMLKDQLLTGVAKDLSSIPIMGLPPEYMDSNASSDKKAAYLAYQALVTNVAAGTQRGIVVPLIYDENGKKLFDFQLLEAKGTNKFDLPEIIKQLQNDILVALSCDVITAGADFTGSFSIGDSKTNLCALAIEHRLNEIKEVLNADLLVQLYALNGWSQDNMPTFAYSDIEDPDMETTSKFYQRVASVGLLERDREVMNKVRTSMGISPRPDDEPVDQENLTNNVSKSGAGLEVNTTGNGTSKIGGDSSGQDQSARNSENKG